MRPHPDAMADVQRLQGLAEQYLERMPLCFLCREMPASMALVYLADSGTRGCVFGVCAVCRCQDDFEHRVNEVLHQDIHQRERAVWD